MNNEWLYSVACAVIFLPTAARLVNTKNPSMSAVRQNVSARYKCFLPSFIPQFDLQLVQNSVAVLSSVTKVRYAPVARLTQCYHSRLPHTSCSDQWKMGQNQE